MNRQRLTTVLSLLLLAGLVYVAKPGRIIESLSSADLKLYFGAATLFLGVYIPITVRWKRLLEGLGTELSLADSFRVVAVSYGMNKVLPANSGDLARSKIVEGYVEVENHGEILGGVALERFLDILTITSIILFSSLFIASRYLASVYLVVAAVTAGLIAAVIGVLYGETLLEVVPGSAGEFLEDVYEGFRSVEREKAVELGFYSVVRWFAEVFIFVLLASALSIDLGFWEAGFITSMMSLIAAFPISPAGLGPVDLTGTGLLVVAGVSSSAGVALVALQRSLGVVLMGFIGFLVYSQVQRSSS